MILLLKWNSLALPRCFKWFSCVLVKKKQANIAVCFEKFSKKCLSGYILPKKQKPLEPFFSIFCSLQKCSQVDLRVKKIDCIWHLPFQFGVVVAVVWKLVVKIKKVWLKSSRLKLLISIWFFTYRLSRSNLFKITKTFEEKN